MDRLIDLTVNGQTISLGVKANETLLDILRDRLGLTGTKYGCGTGRCGACTVLADGQPTSSCITLAVSAAGKEITTIEGLAPDGKLHPIQEEFIKRGAIQCGFCTSGFILTAKALLAENPNPTPEEIRRYVRGNLCRCTGYVKIVEAITAAAQRLGKGQEARK